MADQPATWAFKDKRVAERLSQMAKQSSRRSSLLGGGYASQLDQYTNVKRVMVGIVSEDITPVKYVTEGGDLDSPFTRSPFFRSPYFGGGDDPGEDYGTHTPPFWQFGSGKAIIYRKSRDEHNVAILPEDLRYADMDPFEVTVYNYTTTDYLADTSPTEPGPNAKFHLFVEDSYGNIWIVGSAGSSTNIGIATTNAYNVSDTGTATLIDLITGDYQWEDEPGIVYINTFAQEWQAGEEGLVIKRDDSNQWEMFKPGGSIPIVYFQYTSNKLYGSNTANARPVKPDGTVDMAAPEFQVYDERNRFHGLIGWRGHAVKFRQVTVEDETVDQYRIIEAEGPAHLMGVTVYSSYNPAGTLCQRIGVSDIAGPPTHNRHPISSPFSVKDVLSVASGLTIGQKWLVAFEKGEELYTFVVPLEGIDHKVWRFVTTSAKDWNGATVSANILDDAGSTIAAVTLYDATPSKHECKVGSRGWCITHGGQFYIITCDSPARYIEGTLNADWELSSDSAILTKTFFWGAAPNHLDTDASVFTLYDNIKVRSRKYFAGEKFGGLWDEKQKIFVTHRPPGDYITLRGSSPGVTRATGTFTLVEPAAVNGQLPPGVITVTNYPPMNAPPGSMIYAQFNVLTGTTLNNCWDTANGGNFLYHYRGLADFGTEDRMTVDSHNGDNPHWHKIGNCTPPE